LLLVGVVVAIAATFYPGSRHAVRSPRAPGTIARSGSTVAGVFTVTGGECPGAACEDAMSGVVELRSVSGAVRWINVDDKHPLDHRLSQGRFAVTLRPGSYRISDQVSQQRGGGSCPVFLTGARLQLAGGQHSVSAISVRKGAPIYIRINCPGW
jgi:hypothetical protein